uniref:CSON007143 protein n=1 Tax=Culicoides sonorensis TaxID=179676 RepID=A0A336MUZ6_CULSO
MSSMDSKSQHLSPFSHKNGFYMLYHVMKGRKDKKKENRIEFEESVTVNDKDSLQLYKCPLCELKFNILSSFLLHLYRHSDPKAIEKDIKREEEESEKLNHVEEEQDVTIKDETSVVNVAVIDKSTEGLEFIFDESLTGSDNPQHTKPTGTENSILNFTCDHCNKKFESKSILKHHLKLHAQYFENTHQSSQGIQFCDFCTLEFQNNEELIKEHYLKTHRKASKKCRLCDSHFGSNSLRKTHEQFFHEIQSMNCTSCFFGYQSQKEIKNHYLTCHDDDKNKCGHCDRNFITKIGMIDHLLESHSNLIAKKLCKSLQLLLKISSKNIQGNCNARKNLQKNNKNNFKCSHCEKNFTSEKLMKLHEIRQHIASKEDDPGYFCKMCQKIYMKRASGLRHVKRVHENQSNTKPRSLKNFNSVPIEEGVSCEQCDEQFVNGSALISHLKKTHLDQELIFQCGVCERRTKTFAALREHVEAVHEKKLVYTCDICGKGFTRKTGLRTHMRVNHMTVRNYACPICDQRFAQQNQLNVHVKIHATKKLHNCTICQKSFAQLSGLHQHMSMHSDTPKFHCELCQLSFKYASSFYNHRKSHTSPIEYSCDVCKRICPSRFSLYAHKKAHHNTNRNQKFDCSECGKVFKRKDTLKQHILNKHTQSYVNFKCELCDTGFKTKREMKQHDKSEHKQNI